MLENRALVKCWRPLGHPPQPPVPLTGLFHREGPFPLPALLPGQRPAALGCAAGTAGRWHLGSSGHRRGWLGAWLRGKCRTGLLAAQREVRDSPWGRGRRGGGGVRQRLVLLAGPSWASASAFSLLQSRTHPDPTAPPRFRLLRRSRALLPACSFLLNLHLPCCTLKLLPARFLLIKLRVHGAPSARG